MKSMYKLTARWFTENYRQLPAGKITGMVCLFLLFTHSIIAQTKIGDNPGTPRDPSAMLEVSSTASPFRGLLMPRVTTVQRNAITLPAKGLMIFNTTSNQPEINTGTPAAPIWTTLAPPSSLNWALAGNAGTNPAANFLGTTDAQPLSIRANNTEYLRLTTAGNLGIGLTSPVSKLHLTDGTFRISNAAATATPAMQVINDNGGQGVVDDITINGYGNSTPGFVVSVAGGTAAAPANTPANTVLGAYIMGARVNGTDVVDISGIRGRYTGNGTTVSSDLTLVTSNSIRMRIDSAGDVGIGTTDPSNKLHIAATTDPLRLVGLQPGVSGDQVLTVNATGVVRSMPAGSLAANAWTPTGNAATNPATNFLGTTDAQPLVLRTNNTEQLRLTTAGSLGIGTTTPASKLHVSNGTLRISNTAATVTSAVQVINDNGGQGVVDDITINGFGNSTPGFVVSVAGGTAAAPANTPVNTILGSYIMGARVNGTDIVDISGIRGRYTGTGTTVSSNLEFLTSSLERMRIDSDGDVGIGIADPSNKLHIAAAADPLRLVGLQPGVSGDQVLTVNATGVVRSMPAGSLAANAWTPTGNAATNPATNFLGTTDAQPLVIRTNNAEQLRVTPTGNLGIGIANPASKLHLSSGTVRVSNSAATTSPAMQVINDNGGTGFVDDITINGYGSSTPGFVVSVAGGTVAAPTNTPSNTILGSYIMGARVNGTDIVDISGIRGRYTGTGTTTASTLEFVSSNNVRMILNEAGGINMAVGGGSYNQATGAWTDGSDARYKKNITGIKYGLKAVMSMQPRSYIVKASGVNHFGFVAQELQQVLPEAVFTQSNGYMSIDYSHITAVLAKAVQEQQEEIETLKKVVKEILAEKKILQSEHSKMTELASRIKYLEQTLGVAKK